MHGLGWVIPAVFCVLCGTATAGPVIPFKTFKPVFITDGQLVVAAAVVTDAPYNADNTGKTDASAAIQRAMGAVSGHGGGTVYLPAGRYRIEKNLNMPATITLCGDWEKPVAGRSLSGTILLAYADKGNPDGPALLVSPKCGHANVYNLAVFYPEQDPAAPVPYPFTIDGRVAYMHNITLVNSYQGILMNDFSGSSVSGIYGTALKRGIVLKSSCELGSCYNVRLNSDYWTQLPEAGMSPDNAEKVRAFVRDQLTAVQIGKVDGLSFYNADLAEAKTPVLVKLEDDEQKVMVTSRSQYGFGGGMAKVSGRRTEIEGAWYFGAHYFDLDNYPELAGLQYSFAPMLQAAKTGLESVYQAADFGAVADGTTDDSAALQKALDKAGENGGGTVLLPRGSVLLKAPIKVPAGVELRGAILGPVIRPWYNVTSLIIDHDADVPDPENARAAISLEERAGLRGVFVSYEKNQWETNERGELVIHPYPYAIRGLGREVYVCDVTLNAYNGIDFGQARCDHARIVNLWGMMYRYGIRVGANSDFVQLENISIDIGTINDFRGNRFPNPSGQEKRKIWQHYLDEHAITYLFGDCTNLSTFHLSGFAPHHFMEFVDQGNGGCRDARFWSSIFDVPKVETARFRAGGKIDFYGFFATGGGNKHSVWPEFDETFKGKVNVYGLSQQMTFNNRPYTVGPDRFEIHLEHSLTTGRTATASSFVEGWGPEKALDDSPRTMWQSREGKGPHILTVELAGLSTITRWRLHNAGNFMERQKNTFEAELEGSADGTDYFKIDGFNNNTNAWVDVSVTCAKPVRFVRLKVIRAQAPETKMNRAFIAGFDVFGFNN